MPNHLHDVISILGADLSVCHDINNDDNNQVSGKPCWRINEIIC